MSKTTDPDELRAVMHKAVAYAINKIGMDRFKKCSFFGSNLK